MHTDAVSSTITAGTEFLTKAAEPQRQTVSDTRVASEGNDAQTSEEDADEPEFGSELAPPPDLPTADDTVIRRASIRLVNSPEHDTLSISSGAELPLVPDLNGKTTETTDQARPESQPLSAKQTSIQQDIRPEVTQEEEISKQSDVVERKPAHPSPVAKAKNKKSGKAGEDVPGCKCVIM